MDVKLSNSTVLICAKLILLSSALLLSGCVGAMRGLHNGLDTLELGHYVYGENGSSSAPGREHAYLAVSAAEQPIALSLSQAASANATIPEVKSLASQIATEQSANATHMQTIGVSLFGKNGVPADGAAAVTFSLTAEQAGLAVDPSTLTGANPYDRQFIDLLVPALQGSVRLTQAFLSNSVDQDLELRFLAQTVLAQESAEIVSLNDLRTTNYGAPSPAGGVPAP